VPSCSRIAVLATLLFTMPVWAQSPVPPAAGRPVRTVIASTRVSSVVDTPLHMRLLRVGVPAGQQVASTGPNGMLYLLSGSLDVTVGADHRVLHEGNAVFLAEGSRAILAAAPPTPVVALHFVIGSASQVDQAGPARPAALTELYRTREPLPSLKPGPYEFSLTRVTVEKGVPRPPMHHRSGAALYYVLAGSWTIHMDGKNEPRSRGNVQLEPNGFVHTWEIMGDTTGILLQANISAEGAPEIIFLPSR
jgi:quercetin dioxygenase-like cupin family protein